MIITAYCRVCLSKIYKSSKCTFIPKAIFDVFTRIRNFNLKQFLARTERTNELSGREEFCTESCFYQSSHMCFAKNSELAAARLRVPKSTIYEAIVRRIQH